MYDLINDTIVAISSPVGRAVRGIARMSGPSAVPIAEKLFSPASGQSVGECGSHRRLAGRMDIDREVLPIPAAAYVFRSPRGYTGQDLVEFHLPGSPIVLTMAVRRLLEEGARNALPGEFTARAFANGRLDLTEAEGVAALINARSDAQLAAANRLMHGAAAKSVHRLQDRLTDLLALVEADIDFSDEDTEFISGPELEVRLTELRDELRDIRDSGLTEEQLNVLPVVALVGPPNVGKSSLLNAMSGVDRAICSPVAGTTRDVLSAPLELRRSEALLIDAAGLGSADSRLGREAHRLAEDAARRADLLLFVVDLSRDPLEPGFELLDSLGSPESRVVYLANKVDLLDREEISVRCETLRAGRDQVFWPVSGLLGLGLDRLAALIEAKLQAPEVDRGRELLPLNARHRRAILEAETALRRAVDLVRDRRDVMEAIEVLACEIREASDQLAAVTGAIHPEDLLSRIFGRFCIGK